MTKQGSFKKVVRRHAAETGQRYTEALTAFRTACEHRRAIRVHALLDRESRAGDFAKCSSGCATSAPA